MRPVLSFLQIDATLCLWPWLIQWQTRKKMTTWWKPIANSLTVCTLQKDEFDNFKKLLSPTLAVKWQLIVEEEVVGLVYVSLTST